MRKSLEGMGLTSNILWVEHRAMTPEFQKVGGGGSALILRQN
jgi:hypothetical protein